MIRYTFKPEDKVFAIASFSTIKHVIRKNALPWLSFGESRTPLINYRNLLKTEVFTSIVVRSLFS